MRDIGFHCFDYKTKMTVETYVQLMAEAGFTYTFSFYSGDDSELMRECELMRQYNIKLESIHAPFDRINSMWDKTDCENEMQKRLKRSVDLCVEVNAPTAVVHLSSGIDAPMINDYGIRRYIDLIEYAKKRNINIAFENQRYLSYIAWAIDMSRNYDNIGFCWDVGHEACFTMSQYYMDLFGRRLLQLHIHDNHGVFNKDEHLLPFDGSIDYNYVAKKIRESGYRGSVMLEVGLRNNYEGCSPREYVIKGANAARRISEMIDNK